MYINTTTQTQHSEQDIRTLFPNVSFPYPFVPPDGYAYVFPAPHPTYNAITERVQAAAPVLTNLGHWEQTWEVVPRFVDYTDANNVLHTASEQIAAETERLRLASVPASVTMRQACRALLAADLLDDVEALVATLPREYQIEWQRAGTVERSNPLVEIVRQQKSMSEADIDDLFITAATL